MDTDTLAIRRAACALVKTRFKGRAALERQVRQASLVALARLEVRLGLAEPAEETNMSGEVPAN